jgi:SOS response regulatory protein OraA/RecX
MLAARRLTEAQLWTRLARKAFDDDAIRETVAWCKAERYLDDGLFARLYVEGRERTLSDARLVGQLVHRGIDREAAADAVGRCARTEDERLAAAFGKLERTRPSLGYASAARALERLGFPAAAIYRHLRAHASRFVPDDAMREDSLAASE